MRTQNLQCKNVPTMNIEKKKKKKKKKIEPDLGRTYLLHPNMG
jgi:hypothetical protein